MSARKAPESLGAMSWTLSGPKTNTLGTSMMMMMLIAVVIIIIVRSHLGSSVRVACEWKLLTKHAASKLRLFLRPRRLQPRPWRPLWLGHCQAFQEIQDRDRAYIVGHRPRG